ncbi:MAG TPA: NmrA family NAD(P)-binding protein [Candidatus Acidoferrales bacterium]|nr:NmrA family NAD(P)-binding protein [Candidatus Acidoferrales bacterium]
MYVITGATGHTGAIAAERLLAGGAKVRVIGRDAKRLERLTQKRAEAVVADMNDSAALEKAFAGTRGVYAVIPPNVSAADVRAYQERITDSLATAVRNSGVSYVVALSSTGADKTSGTGPVVGLHNLEQKLGAIPGINLLSLRAGYFMENLLPQIGVIQSMGFIAGPIRADVPLPMIATHDIGEAAAESLAKLDFSGVQTRELLGARHLPYTEAARIIGAGIGKPDLSYRQVPASVLKPALMQMGMSANMVDLMLEMCDGLNTGHMKSQEPRSPRNTTATTLETFVAEVFAPAYRGKAAGA